MPSRTQSILIGGLVVGALSTSVLSVINLLCCAGVIIGAVVGVWHYTETYQITIESGQGALIGAMAGIVGAILAGIFNQLLVVVGLDFAGDMRAMMEQFSQMQGDAGMTFDEQMQMMEQGSWAFMLLGTVFNMVLYGIFGAVGGAIGASVFQKGGDAPTNPSTSATESPDGF